jgi:hypothetical protein
VTRRSDRLARPTPASAAQQHPSPSQQPSQQVSRDTWAYYRLVPEAIERLRDVFAV